LNCDVADWFVLPSAGLVKVGAGRAANTIALLAEADFGELELPFTSSSMVGSLGWTQRTNPAPLQATEIDSPLRQFVSSKGTTRASTAIDKLRRNRSSINSTSGPIAQFMRRRLTLLWRLMTNLLLSKSNDADEHRGVVLRHALNGGFRRQDQR
jgi:hypothetical protein